MIRPFLVFATFLVLFLGGAAGADAADLLAPDPGPDTQHVAWAGLLPQSVQVRAGRPDLLALDLDHRLGRARHQGTEQRQVRALEQRHLLRRSARPCS